MRNSQKAACPAGGNITRTGRLAGPIGKAAKGREVPINEVAEGRRERAGVASRMPPPRQEKREPAPGCDLSGSWYRWQLTDFSYIVLGREPYSEDTTRRNPQ